MSDAEAQGIVDGPAPLSEVVAQLHEKQRILLQTAADAQTYQDGVIEQEDAPPAVQMSYLTRTTDLSNSLVNHHMKALIRDGLAELVQQLERDDPASQPGPLRENVYQCTERGREATENIDDVPIGETLDALRAELERQRDEQARTKSIVMQIAVNTGTYTLKQAKEEMPRERFEQAFPDADY